MVALTIWVLAAPLAAIAIDLAYLFLVKWPNSAGGGFRTVTKAVGRVRFNLVIIAGVDFVGGALMAGVILFLGTGRAEWLNELISNYPVIGWAMVGSLGAPVADRLISGSVVRKSFEGIIAEAGRNAGAQNATVSPGGPELWRLRSESVEAISRSIAKEVGRALKNQAVQLRDLSNARVDANVEDAKLQLLILCDTQKALDKHPPEIAVRTSDIASRAMGNDELRNELKALVEDLIYSGRWLTVESFVDS